MALGDSAKLGYDSFVGIAKEASWGTALTSTAFVEFYSEDVKKTQEGKIIEALGSTGRNPRQRFLGNEVVAGSIECPLNIMEDGVCQLINNAIGGTVTSDGTSDSGYNHVVTQGDMASGTSSLTYTKRVDDEHLFQFAGCRTNVLTVKGEPESELKAAFELIGKYGTTCSDSLTVGLSAVNPLDFSGVKFEAADSVGSLDKSTGLVEITKFEFTLNNNLISDETARALGSRLLSVLPPGKASSSLKVTMRYDTNTMYDVAFGETIQAYRLYLDSLHTLGSLADGTVASMQITYPQAYVETEGPIPSIDNPNIQMMELTITPIQPSTDTDYVQVEYNNDSASY